MLTRKPVILVLVITLIMGFSPVAGWAESSLLTDDEMDAIYAKGILVSFDFDIVLPGGNALSVPSIDIPTPMVDPGLSGTSQQSSPSGASGGATSSPVNVTTPTCGFQPNIIPGTSGVILADNAMQGNSGLVINAPTSAISLSINVMVLNNSKICGDVSQLSKSFPTNMLFSVTTFLP